MQVNRNPRPPREICRGPSIGKAPLPRCVAIRLVVLGLPWLPFSQRPAHVASTIWSPQGNWIVNGPETLRHQHVRLNGNLILQTNAVLTLEDCVLEICDLRFPAKEQGRVTITGLKQHGRLEGREEGGAVKLEP